ncbi:MAG: hypothetical protein ACI9YH_004212 [Colwellia sp.]|jgi:hypothetical protein
MRVVCKVSLIKFILVHSDWGAEQITSSFDVSGFIIKLSNNCMCDELIR